MIRATDIRKRFGELEVLKGVSLEVARGEVVSIAGASGAGKTTLLQILGTLSRPDSGRLLIDGTEPFALGDKALSQFRNERIGFVFQFHHLLPEFTAFENVCIPGFIGRRPRAEVERRADELLALMGLSARRGHKPSQLSGGEQQRVAIARALATGCKTLLLDEPFSALDPKNRFALQELLLSLWEEKHKTVLFVTHDMDEAILLGDRIAFMEPGKIIKRHKVDFPRPRQRETLLISPQCCSLRTELLSLFYKWGEAAEVNP